MAQYGWADERGKQCDWSEQVDGSGQNVIYVEGSRRDRPTNIEIEIEIEIERSRERESEKDKKKKSRLWGFEERWEKGNEFLFLCYPYLLNLSCLR